MAALQRLHNFGFLLYSMDARSLSVLDICLAASDPHNTVCLTPFLFGFDVHFVSCAINEYFDFRSELQNLQINIIRLLYFSL